MLACVDVLEVTRLRAVFVADVFASAPRRDQRTRGASASLMLDGRRK
jgi:hypothetical protein